MPTRHDQGGPLAITLSQLKALITQGEGLHLEFKRKASHPEKIATEIIAFANTGGGTLLIGVDDNGGLPGVKYPDEETLVIRDAIAKLVRPRLNLAEEFIRISENRYVVKFNILKSDRRPHCLILPDGKKETYVRQADMSIKASREMREIVRRSRSPRGVRFLYGEAENALMKYLAENPTITLDQFRKLAHLNKFSASRKLVLLVLAHVLKITPTVKGDIYSRA